MIRPFLLWGLVTVLGLGFLAAFLYWLLVSTEGVYLGRRVVVWLYDLTAHKYDDIKEYNAFEEQILVTRPVLNALQGASAPVLLDVATGTGRVPYDLMQSSSFTGLVVGLDDSRMMLQVAREKLRSYGPRVQLIRHPAVPLPFPDVHFDLVTCLEALEFFPSDEDALREMVRVLKPGRALLATRRRGREAKLFLHRYRSQEDMRVLLRSLGLVDVSFHPWEINYDLISARKPSAVRRDRQTTN